MIEFLFKCKFLVLFFFSLYGWGAFLLWVSGGKFYKTPFYTSSVGMAWLIFMGGLLNGFSLAYASSLNMLLFSGLSITLFLGIRFLLNIKKRADEFQFSAVFSRPWTLWLPGGLYGVFIFTILTFLIVHLIPSSNFNFHDDLQKYIPRAVRMLQTGSLGGNPFGAVGIDSLGAQDFLNAFLLNAADLTYLYALDPVFCFILCALLLIDVAKTLGLNAWLAFIPVFALILINPQSVNISSLYSGTLLTMALFFSLTKLTREIINPAGRLPFARILPVAAITAAIFCLKITFIPFLCAYLLLYFLISFYINRQFKNLVLFLLYFTLASLLFILPWIFTHFDNYSTAILGTTNSVIDGSSAKDSSLYGSSLSAGFENLMSLFTGTSLFYGGKSLSYTLCMVIILLSVVFFGMKKTLLKKEIFFPSMAAACLAAAGTYFIFPFLFPADLGIRYTIPLVIAVFTVAIVFLLSQFKSMYFTRSNSRPHFFEKLTLLTCFILPLMISGADFSKILSQRAGRIIWHNTTLSYPLGEDRYYKNFNEFMFSDAAGQFYAGVQNAVEKDSTILAWVAAPFHLDYTRNRIFSIGDAAGLTSPWLNLPIGADTQTMTAFLMNKKIKYILWEYNGYSMRTRKGYQQLAASSYVGRRMVGIHGLYMFEVLKNIVGQSTVIFQNDRIVVCEIGSQE